MFREYALDPNLFDSITKILLFREAFNHDRGRWVSTFPEDWDSKAIEVIEKTFPKGGNRTKAKAVVRRIREKAMVSRVPNKWDPGLIWINNAIEEHIAQPFWAIIGKTDESDRRNRIISGETFDDPQKLWEIPLTLEVERKATKMGEAINDLLVNSKYIYFIDPHFDPGKYKFRNPFAEFLKIISSRSSNNPIKKIAYHVSDRKDTQYYISLCNQKLTQLIPSTLTIEFCISQKSEMHDRFILTDLGAVQFGIGLDEDDGDGPSKVTISRCGYEFWKDLWYMYSQKSCFHEISHTT